MPGAILTALCAEVHHRRTPRFPARPTCGRKMCRATDTNRNKVRWMRRCCARKIQDETHFFARRSAERPADPGLCLISTFTEIGPEHVHIPLSPDLSKALVVDNANSPRRARKACRMLSVADDFGLTSLMCNLYGSWWRQKIFLPVSSLSSGMVPGGEMGAFHRGRQRGSTAAGQQGSGAAR